MIISDVLLLENLTKYLIDKLNGLLSDITFQIEKVYSPTKIKSLNILNSVSIKQADFLQNYLGKSNIFTLILMINLLDVNVYGSLVKAQTDKNKIKFLKLNWDINNLDINENTTKMNDSIKHIGFYYGGIIKTGYVKLFELEDINIERHYEEMKKIYSPHLCIRYVKYNGNEQVLRDILLVCDEYKLGETHIVEQSISYMNQLLKRITNSTISFILNPDI